MEQSRERNQLVDEEYQHLESFQNGIDEICRASLEEHVTNCSVIAAESRDEHTAALKTRAPITVAFNNLRF
jgi:hypothetical protein